MFPITAKKKFTILQKDPVVQYSLITIATWKSGFTHSWTGSSSHWSPAVWFPGFIVVSWHIPNTLGTIQKGKTLLVGTTALTIGGEVGQARGWGFVWSKSQLLRDSDKRLGWEIALHFNRWLKSFSSSSLTHIPPGEISLKTTLNKSHLHWGT